MSRKVYKKNIKVIYDLLDIYTETDGLAGRLGIERLTRHVDILTKAMGNAYDEEVFNTYKQDNKIENYPTRETYNRDDVYSGIKDIEMMIDFLRSSEDPLRGNFYEGLKGLLEPYSIVFNNFYEFEGRLSGEVRTEDNKSEEEFTYEELVSSGQQPNYNQVEEELEPKTRAERRGRKEKV